MSPVAYQAVNGEQPSKSQNTILQRRVDTMSQPILELKAETTGAEKTTPHLLPCRIHHNGPVEPTESFWNITQSQG